MAHHRSFSDDKSSMQSSFNSNVETASTEITQEQTDLAGYPDQFPPQPRDHNPAQSLPFHPKPQSAVLPSTLLNIEGRGQSVAVNFGHTEVSQHNLTIPKHDETEVMNTPEKSDYSVPERQISTKSQDFLVLHTVGGMFDQGHDLAIEGSGTFTCADDSSDDEDLDLEQFADNFLSEKFGISLDRLRRPDRIVYAFQQARDQCVDVLEDEGHRFIGSACSDDGQSEPNDGGDTYHDGGGGDRFYSMPNSSLASPGTKRPHHHTADSDDLTGPGILAKRRRHKKRRMEGDLSCPFRKRNPRRFNVRDHPECANRSFENISAIKKHIAMFHFKKEACVCVRCNRNYKDLIALGEHMKQCPYPPPSRPPIQYTDPEDGIDIKTDNILKSRKSNEQINNWRTLWETLFPTDPVPCSDFEPVVEDHDLVYNYKRTQSQIAQRLDALGLGPSHEKVKSSIFEEIETLLRCGSSNDQYPTPSSNSNTSPIQPLPREIEIATIEKETSLAAHTPFSADHMVPTFNHEELRSPMQFGIRNTFEADGVTEPSSTSAIPQPLTRYYPRMEPESQSLISLLPEPTQPLEEMAEGIAGLPIRDIGLDMLQSSAQPQLASSLSGTTSFRFPETPQDNQWNLSNDYAFIGNDPNTQWPDSSGGFGYWGINNA